MVLVSGVGSDVGVVFIGVASVAAVGFADSTVGFATIHKLLDYTLDCGKYQDGARFSGANFVFAAGTMSVALDVFDNFGGDVATGDLFDTEARGGINFED